MPAFLRPGPNATPGTAVLVISPWPDADGAGLEVSVQNNGTHETHLDSNGRWQGSLHWIAIPAAQVEAGELRVAVGPSLVDPVLQRLSSNAIRLLVRQPAQAPKQHALRVDDAVLSSAAAGLTPQLSTHGAMQPLPEATPAAPPVQAPPAAAPQLEAAVTETTLEPLLVEDNDPVLDHAEPLAHDAQHQPPEAHTATERDTNSSSKTGLWIVLALVALAAIGAAVWWFMLRAPAPASTNAAAAPAQTACSVGQLAKAQELEFVQQCIESGADSATLLQVITAARDGGQCGIAQRLYANRAQSGDTAIALAYAREYHPEWHSGSSCFGAAEPATARYWYEEVLQREPDNAQAKADLELLP